LHLPNDVGLMVKNADALDAAVCVLAGHDFVTGACQRPENPERARKEGWIWVRSRII
jgi:hypothetical protein